MDDTASLHPFILNVAFIASFSVQAMGVNTPLYSPQVISLDFLKLLMILRTEDGEMCFSLCVEKRCS